MTTKDYYLKELGALRNDGREFAKKNPGLSAFLSSEGQDPDVERMLEGFAFLTGRLRQKLDEELPEIAHNLTQHLWPNYIRPVPSYAVVQFHPLRNDIKNKRVPRGTRMLSRENSDGVVCRFQSCFDTTVMPLELVDVEYATYAKSSSIELDLQMSVAGTLNELTFENLRFFLGGSKFMAKELYLFLERYVEKIEFVLKGEDNSALATFQIPKNSVHGVGFDPNETIVPYPRNSFDGYIMLQEYFCYPSKHLFVDVKHLDALGSLEEELLASSKRFGIKFYFSEALSGVQLPTKENFMLYCTPVVNLFESDAVPIRKTAFEEEYLLAPSEYAKEQSEVFSVENVRGWIPSKGAYEDYFPFESFEASSEAGEYYSVRVKLNQEGTKTESFIRFASAGGLYDDLEQSSATVSVKMLCTNKDAPSKLALGDISVKDPHSPLEVDFSNVTIPTISYPPPIGGDFLWKVISNMSLNYLSLENIETLRTILRTYDFYGAYDRKQKERTEAMLSGLVDIRNRRTEMIHEGLPLRGIETELFLDPTKFVNLAEAYHLCCILNEFFALYCNLNSFHRLVAHIDKNKTFTWPAKLGTQALI